jgi:hypothetical protein
LLPLCGDRGGGPFRVLHLGLAGDSV